MLSRALSKQLYTLRSISRIPNPFLQYPHPFPSLRMCSNHSAPPPAPTEVPAQVVTPVVAAVAPEQSAAPVEGSPAAAGPAKPVKEKKAKPAKGGNLAANMASLELEPKAEFLASRIDLFDKWKKESDEKIAGEYP